jgi:pSer/pThr/pTyr-binding forkhead associated (FHA) protein
MGAAAGLCPGVVAGSMVKIRQGALGGILGGAVGGILFDVIAMMTSTGSVSRFVGFTITGLAIGVAVGLIEEFRKVYWLTVLTGGREGRSYILTRPSTMLGRDELVDVPLFGDSSILKQHASIVLAPSGATLIARPGAPALVNGAHMPQIALQDGDIMEFGRHRLRFHHRFGSAAAPQMVPTDLRSNLQANQGYYVQPTAMPIDITVSRAAVVQGPHMGSVFVLTNGAIMGRDERCDIPLIGDTHLSRQHARFLQEGSKWVVEDGNSMNGLYVNGVRVARHVLAPGDQISAGQTVLQVS